MVLLTAALCLGCASVPPAPPAPVPAPPPVNTAGPATIVVGQPQPCCPKQTLPEFLGLTGLFKAGGALFSRIRARLGMRFPGLEGKPPVLSITDPANMDSPNPAVSAAAEIKAQEDAADQKIKGLRYLATIGCGGCYPDVEQALLAGLDDCTEAVRFEAASALRSTAGNPCQFCASDKCCSPAVQKKLRDVAYGIKDNSNCYKESSARVRRMARLALAGCGDTMVAEPETPIEGPSGSDGAEGADMPMALHSPSGAAANPMPDVNGNPSVSPTSTATPAVEWRSLPPTSRSHVPQAPCRSCAPTSYIETPFPSVVPTTPFFQVD
ncbi:MAG: hypothetical protein KJ000_00885 [Pirellulaceae bacterium]|nr:hypothetical protein [Pirellulaceae bacterium]